MPGTWISINVEVWCRTCGDGLCKQSEAQEGKHSVIEVQVDVCQKCLEREKAASYNEGYEQGATDHEDPA